MSSGFSAGVNLAAEIIGLIELAGQAGTELYLKLHAIGQLGPDEQQNIHNQIMNSDALDEDTKTSYKAWRLSVGLDKPEAPPATGDTKQ
jgi:hypothetical protein